MALFSIGQCPSCVVSYIVDIYDIMMMEKNGVINLRDKSLLNALILCLLLMKSFFVYTELHSVANNRLYIPFTNKKADIR